MLRDPVDVTYIDETIVVVNKPCSIPVHPVGRYKVHSWGPLMMGLGPLMMGVGSV